MTVPSISLRKVVLGKFGQSVLKNLPGLLSLIGCLGQ